MSSYWATLQTGASNAIKSLAVVLLLCAPAYAQANSTCYGKFANPLTDLCWSCIFPLSFGSTPLITKDQEDTPNPSGRFCFCGDPPELGLRMSFWEPARTVDVTRTPWCMVGLSGESIDPGLDVLDGGTGDINTSHLHSFYHAHWYINPILYWLDVLVDHDCLEQSNYDIGYLTELDPFWSDDELNRLINPEAYLFGTVIAQAACAVDCVAATTGFSRNELFWCSGCSGPTYPLLGAVQAHLGGVQSSELSMQRITAKMHREGLMWAADGDKGSCGYYPQVIMDKTNYKSQMLYPIPQTQKINNRCCQPFGRTTVLWGAGKEYPSAGEHFSYQIYRKRNCCMGGIGIGILF